MEDHELVLISAIVNALAAFGCVVIMLRVTEDFGFCSLLQRVKLCHRVTLAALAIWLFANAGYTLANDSPPRWVDLVSQVVLLTVVTCSTIRHLMVGGGRPALDKKIPGRSRG